MHYDSPFSPLQPSGANLITSLVARAPLTPTLTPPGRSPASPCAKLSRPAGTRQSPVSRIPRLMNFIYLERPPTCSGEPRWNCGAAYARARARARAHVRAYGSACRLPFMEKPQAAMSRAAWIPCIRIAVLVLYARLLIRALLFRGRGRFPQLGDAGRITAALSRRGSAGETLASFSLSLSLSLSLACFIWPNASFAATRYRQTSPISGYSGESPGLEKSFREMSMTRSQVLACR